MENKNTKGGFFIFAKIFVFFLLMWGCFFVFGKPAKAADIVISENISWDDGQVIIVNDYNKIIINNQATLTLNPGAIIKLGNKSGIEVLNGNLKVQGNNERPAIITSLKDDKAGGDSNEDGGATKPVPGDWEAIILWSSLGSLNINYGEIKYGNYIASASAAKEFTITNSSILNFHGFIDIGQTKNAKINYSNIYNPDFCTYNNPFGGLPLLEPFCGGAELWSYYIYYVDATNNYWGHPRGSTRNPFDIKGTISRGRVYYNPYLSEKIQLWPEENKLDAVIIVPGILGSFLNKNEPGSPEVWPNVAKMILPGDDSFLNELALTPTGWPDFSDNLFPSDIIRKILIKDFFGGLIDELKNNGYEEGKNLFVFPYDWRLDINWLAGDSPLPNHPGLKEKIEEVKSLTGAEKVDIVAHSMGGLIAKKYLSRYGQGSVNKFIDIATPHLGAPKAFKALMYGEDFGFSAFGLGLNQNTIKYISQNMPSLYELLPSRAYLNINDFNIPDPDYKNYIYDIYDLDNNGVKGGLDYAQSIEFMQNTGRNSALLGFNNGLHNEIDSISFNNSYNIIGCSEPTIGKIYVLNKEKSGKYEYGLKYIEGDATVPLRSAEAFSSPKIYVSGAEHSDLPSAEGVKELVASILKGEEANFNFSEHSNLSTDKSICSFSGTQISYHSPIELHIYDESGNHHLGPDENGDIEMGIEGSSYDIIEGNKFAFLPAGHIYKIVGEATEAGSFNARIESIENSQYGELVYYNEIPLASASSTVEFNIGDEQTDYLMRLDNDGDNIFESEILPSSILNGEEANDLIKPQTSIDVSGTQGGEGWYISNVFIKLTAQDNDNGSGVLKTEYSLDNGQSWENYQSELNIESEGEHKILYASTDRAGNREEEKEASFKLDKTGPVVEFIKPLKDDEFLHSGELEILYEEEDNFSGIASDTLAIFLDEQSVNSDLPIDLFNFSLGAHNIKISLADRAGNISIAEVQFYVTANIDSVISDIGRIEREGMANTKDFTAKFIKELLWIKEYIEKYGEKYEKKYDNFAERMAECLKRKSEDWCEQKIGGLASKILYKLEEVNKKVVLDKYNIILHELESYYKKGWISERGHGIIKEDINYLINNLY